MRNEMSELDKMLSGKHYDPNDSTLLEMGAKARELTAQYNRTSHTQTAEREKLLQKLLGHVGGDITIEPSFACDYGSNISVGKNFFMNFNCVILDTARVVIGDNCFIGPQVGLYTPCHPLDPIERNTGVEFSKPITIGDNCWIGGHATINPGVSLGDNTVVGSGAVVTKSFPDNVVIAGNPARIIKRL